MSNKYAQGNYIITFFDYYGSKIRSVPAKVHSYIKALEEGRIARETLKEVESFTVSRVLYNSKKPVDKRQQGE